ncbi:ribonuclease Y [Jatrophihabitans lederbergiae]|uniref:Ribonuclease Y n=1 Tax=Jatrophihabitans lederbergiae TaxID=3075547 RepID=A0ABU2J801_9ACTN|nr:ribonuclease Y [Jatrophihabitans sp. DSM 44399]MDT0261101.1 ribonuclease Y [Jatrophihabitans sp. DSM 44399]
MNHSVQLVAVAAAFLLLLVLGLRFLSVYASHKGTPAAGGATVAEAAVADQGANALRAAEAEADAVRERTQRDVESARRSLNVELESLRRAAQTEADANRASVEAMKARAEASATDLLADARRSADRELQTRTAAAEGVDADLNARGADLDRCAEELASAGAELERRRTGLDAEQHSLDALRAELETVREQLDVDRVAALERVAGLSSDEAKAELLASVESHARRDAATLVRSIENEARAEGTERARAIVVDAVQRVASEQTAETVVSVLHLPSDEMKGRIIGREGRNIRAFESVTGVNVIIDDTPEAVLLSCFDPVRREIGRITLEKLVLDGRIHPHRIEEVYEQATVEVDELCLRSARDALADVGITDLDERLIPTLGRLKYRTSYGQNVLGHLVETAHIAGVMASELGLEPSLIKRSAFLHDIGKALTHAVEGSHAVIGADLLRRYGESEAVAHAVEAHHNEVQPKTVEAVLTQAADACSASRPGARRESLEAYVKRLERIEQIATARPGVERVFAMQSGREVRVMVLPNEVDDLGAGVIAREVAKQIEDELTYPGQIRVTVVRESRATEVAH